MMLSNYNHISQKFKKRKGSFGMLHKRHTIASKQKQSISRLYFFQSEKGKKLKQVMSERFLKNGSPSMRPEVREKIRISHLGKKLSREHKEKIRLGCFGKKGHKHSIMTKEKIRRSLMGRKLSKARREQISIASSGKNNSMYGKHHSEQTKKKLQQKSREWNIMHPKKKFSNTIIEQKTATELEQRGFIRNEDFFQNFGLANIKNVDFFLPKLNTVIECDGCFYHACQQCGFIKYHQYAPANDAKNKKLLEEAGYSVFRVWGHDINKSIEACIDKINRFSTNSLIPTSSGDRISEDSQKVGTQWSSQR